MANVSLQGLMSFLKREVWRDDFELLRQGHLSVACQKAGILENQGHHQRNTDLASYDIGWMWKELGVAEHRA
jgi:hypothetical protein